MSTGENASFEFDQRPINNELVMQNVFETLEKRFNQAVEKNNRNTDSAYYGIDHLGDQIFYMLRFADSYHKIVTESDSSDVFEVLVPGFETSFRSPYIEKLANNPSAYFLLRRYDTDGSEHLVLVRPYKIETVTENTDEVIGAVDKFFPNLDAIDVPFGLLMQLDSYELIPAGVVPHYSITEEAIRKLSE